MAVFRATASERHYLRNTETIDIDASDKPRKAIAIARELYQKDKDEEAHEYIY